MSNVDWGQLIQVVLQAVLAVALPVVVKFIVDWLRKRLEEMEQSLGERRWYMIQEAVRIAVSAAEQSGLAGLIEDIGEEKKRWAIDAAERFLAQNGLGGLDLDVLADMIESEVRKQFGDRPVEHF
jgi:hypothetical protein